MEISRMTICFLCHKQTEKSKYGSPHTFLQKTGEQRKFAGVDNGEGYFEQDYLCLTCQAKFTLSSQNINLAWELWPADGTEDEL